MEAELADGTILEFPDGTDPLVIQATVKKMLGATQQSTAQLPSAPAAKPQIRTDFALPNAESMKKASSVVNPVGIGETALQMGSGLASTAVGGLAGLVGSVLPGEPGQGARWSQSVQQAGTYEPRTEAGKTLSGAVNALGSGVAHVFKEGGRYVGKQYGLENQGEFAGEMFPVVASIFGLNKPVTSIATTPYTGTGIPQLISGVKSALPTTPVSKPPATQEALAVTQQQRAAAASNADWADAARIEAGKLAQKYNLATDASVSNPSKKSRIETTVAGGSSVVGETLSKLNAPKWGNIYNESVGIGENVLLDKKAFLGLREKLAAPYREVSKMGVFEPDAKALGRLQAVDVPNVVTKGNASAEIAAMRDSLVADIQNGMTGKDAIRQNKALRDAARDLDASNIVSPESATVNRLKRDAYTEMAAALDDLIDANAARTNPKLVPQLRESRKKIAQSYIAQDATDLVTGRLDPSVLAKRLAQGENIDGVLGDMAKIARVYPHVANTKASLWETARSHLSRGGLGGSLGFAAGSMVGAPFVGAVLGASAAEGIGALARKRIASPSYQAKNAMPVDRRIYEATTQAPQQLLGMEGYAPPTAFRESTTNFTTPPNRGVPEGMQPKSSDYFQPLLTRSKGPTFHQPPLSTLSPEEMVNRVRFPNDVAKAEYVRATEALRIAQEKEAALQAVSARNMNKAQKLQLRQMMENNREAVAIANARLQALDNMYLELEAKASKTRPPKRGMLTGNTP